MLEKGIKKLKSFVVKIAAKGLNKRKPLHSKSRGYRQQRNIPFLYFRFHPHARCKTSISDTMNTQQLSNNFEINFSV